MADLAVVFGWSPETMDPMSLSELSGWRERARKRWEPDER